jgi:hypothetical protein
MSILVFYFVILPSASPIVILIVLIFKSEGLLKVNYCSVYIIVRSGRQDILIRARYTLSLSVSTLEERGEKGTAPRREQQFGDQAERITFFCCVKSLLSSVCRHLVLLAQICFRGGRLGGP